MLTLKSSPVVRLGVAAGLYLLLMWGYMALPSGQWFAAFLALIMSAMLIFWVSETAAEVEASTESSPLALSPPMASLPVDLTTEPSLEASVVRLDSLKSELMQQYAQFGRDQASINSHGLGSWHGTRTPRAR